MYHVFLNQDIAKTSKEDDGVEINGVSDSDLKALFLECGGVSVSSGLYRVHSFKTSIHWSQILNRIFRNYNGEIIPFGYDWLGRQYCKLSSQNNVIAMFDPATIEGYQLAGNIVSFHEKDLVFERDETVSENTFYSLLKFLAIEALKNSECIGYRVPLLLGGEDKYSNFEITDLEVYWEMQAQINIQIKNLPPNTKISSIKYEK